MAARRFSRHLRPWSAVAPTLALILSVATTASATSASLPPLDHAAVVAAIQNSTSGGLPSYVFHAVDEWGEWSAAAGVADLKKPDPADPDAAFRIGSISKMFVSVAVLQLVNEGKIGLDTPVAQYLPGLLKRGDVITIRMLLQHRAGLAATPFGTGAGNNWFAAIQQACNTYLDPVAVIQAADQQLFEPGTSFNYANAGYTTLELVIEKVTGEPYAQVLNDRIVVPLGLTHTSFQDGAPVWPGPFIHGYGDFRPGNGNYYQDHLSDETDCRMSQFGAAGSGISTGRDLTTFLRGLAGGRLLPQALYAQMIDGQPTDGGLPPNDTYGMGVIVEKTHCGVTIVGHGGAVFGYQSDAYMTADGTRTLADGIPVFPGTDADFAPLAPVYNAELCGGH